MLPVEHQGVQILEVQLPGGAVVLFGQGQGILKTGLPLDCILFSSCLG